MGNKPLEHGGDSLFEKRKGKKKKEESKAQTAEINKDSATRDENTFKIEFMFSIKKETIRKWNFNIMTQVRYN